ncbi:DUF3363 domain-containing protein [Cupriavidus pauculus]|uniref:Type VI secretion protein n=1 Tax=Cupriavidus pauculus TaxID=82633 RepID=A0A2N5C6P6_9BURK|nr:DUF3363 domain-containing protein [Cupriavidus pauculus]PLP97899.1 type VI secretion protein [Cupriavidus pauculus]
MSGSEDNPFWLRPGAPRQRESGLVERVLHQAGKAGGKVGNLVGKGTHHRPGARLGRGHVAGRCAEDARSGASRRVTVKTRIVDMAKTGPGAIGLHLRYIARDGVGREGEAGQAYGPAADEADLDAFRMRSAGDRHQFRLIVSPEAAGELVDLRTYTRHLMTRVEADLGTRLEWVAANHWNTANPHVHIVLRGKDETGQDLIIAGDYISQTMRQRASELATDWLGPRTELEMRRGCLHEVEQNRWTDLDSTLQSALAPDGLARKAIFDATHPGSGKALKNRLHHLVRLGLAAERQPGVWKVSRHAEATLRALGDRADMILTTQRALAGRPRELAVFEPHEAGHGIVGRVVGKGLTDERHDKAYLVVDGVDGKAHYIALPMRAELSQYPKGAVIEVSGSAVSRVIDGNIAAMAVNGIYRVDHHLAIAQGAPRGAEQGERKDEERDGGRGEHDPEMILTRHLQRLRVLRQAGIVERVAEGIWRVPVDLTERGRQHDATHRTGGVTIGLKSSLPVHRQIRLVAPTWLDRQLLVDGRGLAEVGFGGEVRQALHERAGFLVEQRLAVRREDRVFLAPNLLVALRGRELEAAAQEIAKQTGLVNRPLVEGRLAEGIYRRSVTLASGRFAMLDDGTGFCLVPWKPIIERHLGQRVAAQMHGGDVSWDIGRQRRPAMS